MSSQHSPGYFKKYRERHKALGLCYVCPLPVFKNIIFCEYHRTQRMKASKKRAVKIRREVLTHYGGECACCYENQIEFLGIDHINGGGGQHRKKVSYGSGGKPFYFWLKKNNFPSGYQVLCMNCNWAKGVYGYCPHNTTT